MIYIFVLLCLLKFKIKLKVNYYEKDLLNGSFFRSDDVRF